MFTPEVIEQLQYYVYRLIDPRTGQTFYVGKGKGNRIYAHINDALKSFDGQSYESNDEDEISEKIKQIREIKAAGLEVIHVIQTGLTNIQGGYSSDRGVNSAEVLQRVLSCEEFKDQPDLKYCIIKINDHVLNERGSVYETVRKHWKVNLSRVKKIPYVLACHNGIVAEVYEIEKWYRSDEMPKRCEFIGKVADDGIRQLFINKRLPKRYCKKGMASPVLYHD